MQAGQLLRIFGQASQERGDGRKRLGGGLGLGVRACDADRRLPRMPRARRDRREEQRPAGDRLAVETGIGEADENVPPVVKQRKQPGREPATRQVVRREAAPAPLVLHLVENILAVAPVAIELTERLCFFVERSDQNRVFVDFRRFADLDERKLRRAAIVAQRKPQSALQAPA